MSTSSEWDRQGFLGPVDALSPSSASACLGLYDEYEARVGGTVSGEHRFQTHLFLPWVTEVRKHKEP